MYKIYKIFSHLTVLFIIFFINSCAIHTAQIDNADKEHIKEILDPSYSNFLNKLSSLERDMKPICDATIAKGNANSAACNDMSMLQSLDTTSLQTICSMGGSNACFLNGQRALGNTDIESENIELNIVMNAYNNFQKSCTGGQKQACYNAGLISKHFDISQSISFFKKACDASLVQACKALYLLSNKSNENQDLYYKILDFGDDSMCKGDSCLIQGRFVEDRILQTQCEKGSGMACVAVVRKLRRMPLSYIQTAKILLEKHCFIRHYVPACEELQDVYTSQKDYKSWLAAGSIACKSDFFADGILGYQKTPYICTHVADSIEYNIHSTQLDENKQRALILYKIGCERGNEQAACGKLNLLLTKIQP